MDADYISKVNSVVAAAVSRTRNFYDVIIEASGVHPIEILKSIDRLYSVGDIDERHYQTLIKSSSDARSTESIQSAQTLPIPHQVDYDWRFSENGTKYFISYINDYIAKKDHYCHIAFIGSPTLFRHYCDISFEKAEIYLIDFNAEKHVSKNRLPSHAHIINCNLNYDLDVDLEIEKIQADLIIIDPPWYLEYYTKFFEIGNIVSCSKCTVIGVFPPILTRESILEERVEIDDYIKMLGFNGLQYKSLCIEYDTPPFEKNVLYANGILNYPTNWRKGDFFSTYREQCIIKKENQIPCLVRNGGWVEKDIEIVRFKIRTNVTDEDKGFHIRLETLYPNNIYPSVSRRFQGHEKINVWTSGNRVFYCSNIPVLFMILERLYENNIVELFEAEYGEIIPNYQKKQINNVQNAIRLVIDLELNEYGERRE